ADVQGEMEVAVRQGIDVGDGQGGQVDRAAHEGCQETVGDRPSRPRQRWLPTLDRGGGQRSFRSRRRAFAGSVGVRSDISHGEARFPSPRSAYTTEYAEPVTVGARTGHPTLLGMKRGTRYPFSDPRPARPASQGSSHPVARRNDVDQRPSDPPADGGWRTPARAWASWRLRVSSSS